MPLIPAQHLTEFSVALLQAGGVSPAEAKLVGESLVASNLRGHDSHGVMRIAQYLNSVATGEVKPGAELTIINESPTLVQADGNWGFGQTQTTRLTERLIAKARDSGMAIGTLVHSSHIGRLGEYCEQAAAAGLVSMMMVNTHGVAARVAPPGGTAPRLGTNPIAFGVPHPDGTLILDFGTSTTAEGKVRVKRIAGEKCPDGWLLDCEGKPTNDPTTLYGTPPGTIRPFGGDQPHKGLALGLMVEIFSGALAGGPCIREKPLTQLGNCVFEMLINPAHVGGAQHFACEVENLVKYIRDCPRAVGVDEILLPGDPERKTLAKRQAEGVPIDEGNWKQLTEIAVKLGVRVPL